MLHARLPLTPGRAPPALLASAPQVDLGGGRQLPLLRLRGQVRPVLVAGTRSFVDKALKEAEPYRMALRSRGVSGA